MGGINLLMLKNSPQESWNEVNPMPTHMHDFGHLWTNMANVTDRQCLRATVPRGELSPFLSSGHAGPFVVAIFASFASQCVVTRCCCSTPLIHMYRVNSNYQVWLAQCDNM